MRNVARSARARIGDSSGITLPELMIALAVGVVVATLGIASYGQYRESISATRAAKVISADVLLTRSLAIRARAPVSLVADEGDRRYFVRDTTGTVFHQRRFDRQSEIPLTSLDVITPGDSLTFDSRGILVNGGLPQVRAVRRSKSRTITFNALGRSRIN